MRRTYTYLVTLLLCLPTCMRAQSETLSVDECVAMALENNINVRAAALKVNQAEQQKKELFTSFFPSVSLDGGAYMMNRYTIDVTLFDIPILQYIKNGTMLGVTAIQPIFMGGQIINGNKLARVGVEVSKLEQAKSSDEVRLQTEKYYWDIVVLQSKLRTVNAIDSMLTRLLADVEVAVKAGVRMRNDLLQVQLKKNDAEADRLKVDHALGICNQLLAQYIGAEEVHIDPSVADVLPAFPINLKTDHQAALLNTNDYQLLEQNLRAQQLNKRLAVGKNLPQLAVGGSLFTHDILDERQNRAALFATVSIPLTSWWGGSHAIKRTKYAEELAREQMDDNTRLLLIQMEDNWNTLEEAYRQMMIAQKSIEQSEENLHINENSYRAGTIPLSELLEAQSIYQESSNNFVQALADYHLAETNYKISTGLPL